MIGDGRPLLHEIMDQSDRVGAKSPIFDLIAVPKLCNVARGPKAPE